jgi:hypothetical protein
MTEDLQLLLLVVIQSSLPSWDLVARVVEKSSRESLPPTAEPYTTTVACTINK